MLPFLEPEIDPADLTERILQGNLSGFVTIYGGEETHKFDPTRHQSEDFNDGYYSDEEISDCEDVDGVTKWSVKEKASREFELKWKNRKLRKEKTKKLSEIRSWFKAPDLEAATLSATHRREPRQTDEESGRVRPSTSHRSTGDTDRIEPRPHFLRPGVRNANLDLSKLVPSKENADFKIQATHVNADPTTNRDVLMNVGFVPQKDYIDSTELSRYTQAQIAHIVQNRKGVEAMTKDDYVKYTASKPPKTHLRFPLFC